MDNVATFYIPEDRSEEAWQETIRQVSSVIKDIQQTIQQLDDSDFERPADEDGTSVKDYLYIIAMHDANHIGQIIYIRKLQGITR